jgi:hypothetical protein
MHYVDCCTSLMTNCGISLDCRKMITVELMEASVLQEVTVKTDFYKRVSLTSLCVLLCIELLISSFLQGVRFFVYILVKGVS